MNFKLPTLSGGKDALTSMFKEMASKLLKDVDKKIDKKFDAENIQSVVIVVTRLSPQIIVETTRTDGTRDREAINKNEIHLLLNKF